MCGIGGIYGMPKSWRETKLDKLTSKLTHRGPDARGVFHDESISLGHTRLKIIDLSNAANQPMESPDKRFVLVFNGEIFNYQSLKIRFKNYPFSTNSDSETILAAWQEMGIQCLELLEGQFAFALYDKAEQILHLVRDRLGIKPLYYYHDKDILVFASEIRSILALDLFKPSIQSESLVDYLRYQTVHGPNTIIHQIKQLPQGHYLTAGFDEVSITPYWDIRIAFDENGYYRSVEDARIKVKTALMESVEKRLVTDVPFGAFLSGGIDSSLMVALMTQIMTEKVRTFHVAFDESAYSEARYARKVSEKFNTDHTEILLKPELLMESVPDILRDMDHPGGDGFNTWLVSKVTRQAGIKMAISGLGGDELFAGYPIFKRYKSLLNKKWVLSFPRGLRKLAGDVLVRGKPGIASEKIARVLIQDYFDLEYIYQYDRQVLLDEQIKRIIEPIPMPERSVFKRVHEAVGFETEGYALPPLSRVSWAEMNTYMVDVLLRDTDQMSMAHALEVRVPFLDHALVQTVMGFRDDVKYPVTPKKLLVDSFPELLPDEIVHRPKMGFVFPWDIWLRNELRSFSREGLNALKERPEFIAGGLDQLWNDFEKRNSKVTWSRVWPLIVLGNWLKLHEIT
jgi:asparagine synthase (glutamine-hydrolysing)